MKVYHLLLARHSTSPSFLPCGDEIHFTYYRILRSPLTSRKLFIQRLSKSVPRLKVVCAQVSLLVLTLCTLTLKELMGRTSSQVYSATLIPPVGIRLNAKNGSSYASSSVSPSSSSTSSEECHGHGSHQFRQPFYTAPLATIFFRR